MKSVTVTITDDQWLMVQWEAERRGITEDQLIAAALGDIMAPLAARFTQNHVNEVAALFEKLAPADQMQFLSDIKSVTNQ